MRSGKTSWLQSTIVAAAAVTLFILESKRRLRPARREPRSVHTLRNLAIAGAAAIVVNGIETPLSMRIARKATPGIARVALEVALLDYGLYLWHVLTHEVPLLWRFHLVHHVDLDLDASTALRFHFGEMLLSVPWRVGQVAVIGASQRAVIAWQTLLFLSILFHHSNLKLPLAFERVLRFLIVTPRLHGIHHQPELTCTDSNWSSGLAVWDMLHGTYCWREDHDTRIGVPGYEDPGQVALGKALAMPFRDVPPGFNREASRLRLLAG